MKPVKLKFVSGLFALSTVWLLAGMAAEKDYLLLFHAGFDSYSAHADFAEGRKECRGIAPDLQLRMHHGIAGKGNALCLNNKECCLWKFINPPSIRQPGAAAL